MEALKAVVRGALMTLVGLAVVGSTLYFFGGMWVRTPEMRLAYEQAVDEGRAEPVDGRFVIPIPGCVCHSDDPLVQAQHAERRIRDCMECH